MLKIDASAAPGQVSLSAAGFGSVGGRVILHPAVAPLYGGQSLHAHLRADRDGAVVVEVANGGSEPVRIERVTIDFPAESFDPPLRAREYRHLVQSLTFEWKSGVKQVHLPATWSMDTSNPPANLFVVLRNDQTGNDALLLGALPPFGAGYTFFRLLHDALHTEGNFGIQIEFDVRMTLAPGASLRNAPIVALSGSSDEGLMQQYGQLMRQRLGNRALKPPVMGWNSWDYYAGAVQRRDVDENVQAARRHFGDALKYIVVDEGYECQWGVWDAGWKFPQGLADLCRSVRAAGYEPGIWTAPLMVNVMTPLFRENPEWFVSDAAGNVHLEQLGYGQMAQLDITCEPVREHLRATFARLRGDGFTYFKCDFTQHILHAERFARSDIGRADIIRRTFELIRQSIGDDAYLVACGAPAESVIGIADAIRITADIHHFWGHVAHNFRGYLCRWWMQGNVCNVDPDFAIIRCDETSDDPRWRRFRRIPVRPRMLDDGWLRGPEMNLDEAKAIGLMVHLSGGDRVLGDALHKLNALGIDLLKRVLAPIAVPARPVNLFEPRGADVPVMVSQSAAGHLLAIFNLTDEPAQAMIPGGVLPGAIGPIEAREFWTDVVEPLDLRKAIALPPRCARCWRIAESP